MFKNFNWFSDRGRNGWGGHSQSFRESGAQSTDWLLAGARLWWLGTELVLLPKLVPSCRRLMWRITAVALNACCNKTNRYDQKKKQQHFFFNKHKKKSRVLTLHLLLAKFFLICRLTDSWMFLQRAVSPAILFIFTKKGGGRSHWHIPKQHTRMIYIFIPAMPEESSSCCFQLCSLHLFLFGCSTFDRWAADSDTFLITFPYETLSMKAISLH